MTKGGAMSVEERIRFLLRAALRAEGEGDRKVARALRRMAEEALFPASSSSLPATSTVGGLTE
jgi:hypothetical protein